MSEERRAKRKNEIKRRGADKKSGTKAPRVPDGDYPFCPISFSLSWVCPGDFSAHGKRDLAENPRGVYLGAYNYNVSRLYVHIHTFSGEIKQIQVVNMMRLVAYVALINFNCTHIRSHVL